MNIGAFGVVYAGLWKQWKVAVKTTTECDASDKDKAIEELVKEAAIMV